MDWVDDVLRFWFDELSPKDWWRGSPELDVRIRTRFADSYERLRRTPPALDGIDARAHLALVIVLDQFPRHLFRGRAAAFATDAAALAVTGDAIDRQLDAMLDERGRYFLYMPLMHSEDPAVQRRSIAQFGRLTDPGASRSAREHADLIERFGRFPARNAALGRVSTAAEIAFLAKA